MTSDWLLATLAAHAAAFFKAFGMSLFMPLIGDAPVSMMLRVMLAIWFAVAAAPHAPMTAPPDGLAMFVAFLQGVLIAGIARLVISAFQTGAALVIAQGGLNLGTLLNPVMQQPSSSIELMFYMLALKMFAESGLLGMLLAADIPLGALTGGTIGDAVMLLGTAFVRSLQIAIGIALPFIVANIAFVLACGMANMFFKQLPVVMILQPLQIAATVVLLALYLDATVFPLVVAAAFDGLLASSDSR